jgi:broad specificity phosphatase PhoE
MDIYFVRHGQTDGNAARRHQADKTQLSKLGEEQVAKTAAVVATYEPTHLLSSHLIRAIESARAISETTGLDIEIDHNLAELRRPRYLEGRYHFSAQSMFYYVLWFLGIENKKLAGESYGQVRQRIAVMKNILKRYPADAKVVAVSHSVFINLFVAHMCRANSLNIFRLVGVVSKIMSIPNAGVIHVRYDESTDSVCKWQVIEAVDKEVVAAEVGE